MRVSPQTDSADVSDWLSRTTVVCPLCHQVLCLCVCLCVRVCGWVCLCLCVWQARLCESFEAGHSDTSVYVYLSLSRSVALP